MIPRPYAPLPAVEVESHLDSIKDAVAREDKRALMNLVYAYTFAQQRHHGEEFRRYVEPIESPPYDVETFVGEELDAYFEQRRLEFIAGVPKHRAALAAIKEEILRWAGDSAAHPGWCATVETTGDFSDTTLLLSLTALEGEETGQLRIRLRFMREKNADLVTSYGIYRSLQDSLRPLIERLGADGWLTGLHLEG